MSITLTGSELEKATLSTLRELCGLKKLSQSGSIDELRTSLCQHTDNAELQKLTEKHNAAVEEIAALKKQLDELKSADPDQPPARRKGALNFKEFWTFDDFQQGSIKAEEFRLAAVFRSLLSPGEKEMTKEQFVHACEMQLGLDHSEKELDVLFNVCDADHNGTIDEHSFVHGIVQRNMLKGHALGADEIGEAFDEMTDHTECLTYDAFKKVCIDNLDLDLSEVELHRVFAKIDHDHNGTIDRDEFVAGVRRRAFLRQIATTYRHGGNGSIFEIPGDFDYDESTNHNYKADNMEFYGEYADIRANADYSYHVNYTKERQEWQNSVISMNVTRVEAQASPWIVFTCGAMGAGKGYALSWMSNQGYFPIEDIVHIDPDYYKRRMPEWKGYLAKEKNVGTMCHRESGFIQEIAQEVALRNRQNVWVDGSLRDGPWFQKVFADIRTRFPDYQISIIYVCASEAMIRERIERRSKVTGRSIPEDLIKESIAAPEHSINLLTPLSDFMVRVNNEDKMPKLEAFCNIDRRGRWKVVADKFADAADY